MVYNGVITKLKVKGFVMKKIIITGGDNGYCGRCGGLCDRLVMECDTDKKTLRYIDGAGLCLGKFCWHEHICSDGTKLVRDDVWRARGGVRVRVRAYRDGVEIPCVVKNRKWGKDGDPDRKGKHRLYLWFCFSNWPSRRSFSIKA